MGLWARAKDRVARRLVESLLPERRSELDALLKGWFPDAFKSNSGTSVSTETSIRQSAVFGCVRVLSWTIGTMPLKVYRTTDGKRQEVRDHPVARLLRRPNPIMTGVGFRQTGQAWRTMDGNSYAEIMYDGGGRITALFPWPSTHVKVTWDGWVPTYEFKTSSGWVKQVPGKVMHIRGLSLNGRDGLSVISYAREAIGLGLSEEEFGARRYSNDARPSLIFKPADGTVFPDAERKTFLTKWKEAHQGKNKAWGVDILPYGLDIERIGMSQRDAQWIESQGFTLRQICRFYGVAPSKIYENAELAYKNAVEINAAFAKDTVLPLTISLEDQYERILFSPEEQDTYSIKHSFEGLLRASPEIRAAFYKDMSAVGAMGPDEIREKEEMEPLPNGAGNIHTVPLNMQILETLGDEPELLSVPAPARARREARKQAGAERVKTREAWQIKMAVSADQAVRGEVRTLKDTLGRMLDAGDTAGIADTLDMIYREDKALFAFIRDKMAPPISGTITALSDIGVAEIGGQQILSLERWIDGYIDRFTLAHSRSSRRQLQAIAHEAGSEGVKNEILARMDEWINGGQGATRAGKIAAREVVQMDGSIAREIWRSNGISKIRWSANAGACNLCKALDGRVVGIEGAFIPAGAQLDTDGNIGDIVNQPAEGEQAPIKAGSDVLHPPLHGGCVCTISVG